MVYFAAFTHLLFGCGGLTVDRARTPDCSCTVFEARQAELAEGAKELRDGQCRWLPKKADGSRISDSF